MHISLIFINFARIKNAIFVSFYLDSRAGPASPNRQERGGVAIFRIRVRKINQSGVVISDDLPFIEN